MKRVIVLASLALGLVFMLACGSNRADAALQGAANLVVPTAIAQDSGGAKGCSIIGSWTTTLTPKFMPPDAPDLNIPWLNTLTGESSHSGTIVTTVPLWPVPFGESGAVKVTDLRGVWERTGGNTFKFTQIGWGLNENNVGVIAFRNSGTTTL